MKTKVCTRCKKKKPVSVFCMDKRRTDGYGSWCIPCCTATGKKYKINTKPYNKMLKEQNNLCAICGEKESVVDSRWKTKRSMAVDHNHKTGKIRGLLCTKCNLALGLVNEDINILSAMIDYLNVK